MGAWIETCAPGSRYHTAPVAPYMGAWIETELWIQTLTKELSRTLYGCVD